MFEKLLFWLSGFLPCRLIEANYLERYFICKIFGWTFLLHRFVGIDGDRYLHNHPWHRGVSIVLKGYYVERLENDSYKRQSVNVVGGNKFHRIVMIERRTWTLMIHSPKVKNWGFYKDGKFIEMPTAPEGWWKKVPKGRYCPRKPISWNG